MPISLEQFAPRDERKAVTLRLDAPTGTKFPVEVEFYVNRLTSEPVKMDEPDDDDEDETGRTALRNAQAFCDIVASWDLLGPVYSRTGETLVERDAPVPLEPHVVRCVPMWFTSEITSKLIDLAFPNRSGSRGSRRR